MFRLFYLGHDQFERMFQNAGDANHPGFGSQPQRQKPMPKPKLFPNNNEYGVTPLGEAKSPDSSSKYIWLVKFYFDDCRTCQEAQSLLGTLLEKITTKGLFKIGAVNCQRTKSEQTFCNKKHAVNPNRLPAFGMVVDH